LWQWWPMLELEEGKTYRVHLASMDWLHGFSLQPENINVEVHPGYEHVVTMTPTKAGVYSIICNEYCGINHHTMASKLYVVKK
jgi:cytochrome c oxidase subunit 2